RIFLPFRNRNADGADARMRRVRPCTRKRADAMIGQVWPCSGRRIMTGTGFTRRQALLAGAAFVLGAGTGPGTARATNGWQAALSAFTDGLQPVASGITLDLPEIAENGNMVPMTIRVESPMTPDDHVAEVIVIATDNPEPE